MKKNGFVFIETVVVICVLAVTLLVLYASYSHVLRVTREKSTFDTTDNIYTTYYVKKVIDSISGNTETFFQSHTNYCHSINNDTGYMCDISSVPDTDISLYQLKTIYDVEKIYLLTPSNILTNTNKVSYLLELDATSIDYVESLGVGATKKLLIVKYKHVYDNGSYEVFHASMEVENE